MVINTKHNLSRSFGEVIIVGIHEGPSEHAAAGPEEEL
jgi:hypothetical protein